MRDRYGNSVTTHSPEAYDAYCAGVDLFLAAQAGGIEKLTEATELDPSFALAHADLARALQIIAKPRQAREFMTKALAEMDASHSLDEQELAHIQIVGLLVAGNGAQAFEQIKQHIKTYPRDVLTVQPCCGVFGLIGFSGRDNREEENQEFMAALQDHYREDWWFESQFAFALCETGDLGRAEELNEAAFSRYPINANAAHHRAHIHYETGEFAAGREQLNQWRAGYSRDGILHCHLAWHDALWALDAGDTERLWQIVAADILPEVTSAPPINVMTDLVAVLLRARLKGFSPPDGLWQLASDYAAQCFPKPAVSFADAHSAIAHAAVGAQERLGALKHAEKGWASATVAAIARGFAAFEQKDWLAMLKELNPAMAEHSKLGGSRAQRDLLALAVAYAELELGRTPSSERAKRLL